MIALLRDELFAGEETDDLALLALLGEQRGRYKVRLEPAYRPRGKTAFHRWLAAQSPRVQETIHLVLELGLKEREFRVPHGEPKVIVERRAAPVWPDSFVDGPVRLPLEVAKDLLTQPLRLLLENVRNDWGFLKKVAPSVWEDRWSRAIEKRWIQPESGGGVTEIPNIIREQIAEDHPRRLRTWVMFDSDGRQDGHRSGESQRALEACQEWKISHHPLRRRAIENYIPRDTLFDWARRQRRELREEKLECVRAFCSLTAEQRHYYNLKGGFKADSESGQGVSAIYGQVQPSGPLWTGLHRNLAQDVWGEDPDANPFAVPETALENDGFGLERAQIFQSIFGML